MSRNSLVLALLAAATIAPATAADPTCLQSGTGQVVITGTLIQKVVPGPPSYTSVNRGDAPQLRWMLRLEAAMCVTAAATDGGEGPDVSDVRVIQLVLPASTIAKHADLVGKRVTASGFVSTRQIDDQNAVVILDVKNLDEVN